MVVCAMCIDTNTKSKPKKELYASVKSVVEKWTGVFMVKNYDGDSAMPMWTKEY